MTRSTALIIALVIAGGAVAAVLLVNGGGGGGDTPTIPTVAQTVTSATTSSTTTSGEPETVQVEATVTSYVSAAEEGDATAVCNLQVDGAGSGVTSAQACASQAGIQLDDLPALAKLKVQDVKVDGDSATAKLGRFGEFTLRKDNGQWKVAGFRPATSGATPSGGASNGPGGGSAPAPKPRERQNPGGTAAPSGTGGASAP